MRANKTEKRDVTRSAIRYSSDMNEHIVIDPTVCHGNPCIKGTRIMVTNVLSLLAVGYDFERIRKNYPELTDENIRATIEYAQDVVQDEGILLTAP